MAHTCPPMVEIFQLILVILCCASASSCTVMSVDQVAALCPVHDSQSAIEENEAVDVFSWDFLPYLVRGSGDVESMWVFPRK